MENHKMKFNTVKEMETELKKATSLKALQENITFVTQGNLVEVEYLGTGKNALTQDVVYLSREDVHSVRITFEGEGDAITVTNVIVHR
jgi:hypothetical protein